MRIVFDLETEGLTEPSFDINGDIKPAASRIRCLCYEDMDTGDKVTLTTYQEMRELFQQEDLTVIGHNIIRYDAKVLRNVLGIDLKGVRMIDTLALSWYLFPGRKKHGLDVWGGEYGITKVKVEDWETAPIELLVKRCSVDVKINIRLFRQQLERLRAIYIDGEKMKRIMGYLTFKMECAAEQESVKWRIDLEKLIEGLEFLKEEKRKKEEILTQAMPEKIHTKWIKKPEKMYKEDESLSERGKKWLEFLQSQGLPEYYLGSVEVECSREKGNPRSHAQVKKWLDSLGWKPDTFKYNGNRAIPQISVIDGTEVCYSVKMLYDIEPVLQHLEGFYVINHRIGLLEAFIDKSKNRNNNALMDGSVRAEIQGLTNTLRFQHSKPVVNLPLVSKLYGDIVRRVLVSPDDDHVLCGADCSGLEEATKHHYIMEFDAEYVRELRTKDYDPHADLAVLAGLMTREDKMFYKSFRREEAVNGEIERYKELKDIRLRAKRVNFAAVYGAGPPKIAQTAGISLQEAKELFRVYWKRNKSVKLIANACRTKVVDGEMWLRNPVSEFWYSLRAEKDRFSTLNQSTAVYCFDTWVRKVRSKGIKLCGQFHDELIAPVRKEDIEKTRRLLSQSITEANKELKLRVELGIDIQFGDSYADIH